MIKATFNLNRLLKNAEPVMPTQEQAENALKRASTTDLGAIFPAVSNTDDNEFSGDIAATQVTNPQGDQTMSTMISKARANRTRALRVHALRSASVTNLFAPIERPEANVSPERQQMNNDNSRRMLRSLPRFVSQRGQAQPMYAA